MTKLWKAKNMQIVATKPDSTFPHFVSLVGWCGKVYIGKPLPCGKVCISTPLHTKYHRNWSVVVHFGECGHMLCTYIIQFTVQDIVDNGTMEHMANTMAQYGTLADFDLSIDCTNVYQWWEQ